MLSMVCAALATAGVALDAQAPPAVTAIRAGRLLDPEGGRILANQKRILGR